jgi:hypothetical protein
MSTTTRGYGWTHQQLRAALLRALAPGSPCPRCGQPMWPGLQALDLGHVEGSGKRLYEGLQHAKCNRSSGAKYGNQLRGRDGTVTRNRQRWRRRGWRPPEDPPPPPARSRRW